MKSIPLIFYLLEPQLYIAVREEGLQKAYVLFLKFNLAKPLFIVRVEKRKMKSEDPGILRVLQINFKYNYSGGIMKNMMKNQSLVILGSLAGICLLGTVAFANPSLVPDHPGYPMKESKSPVSGVSTANDPGQENLYGQNALNAATKEYTKDMKTRRSGVPEANESESQNQMGERNQMKGHNQMSDQNK